MKKVSSIAITLLSALFVASCSSGGPKFDPNDRSTKDVYRAFYAYDPSSFNYASSNKGEDSAHFANFVDGLYEGDVLGLTYKPALAVGEPVLGSWSVGGRTGISYKITVKSDIKWVNSEGVVQAQYGNLKPSDFVTTAIRALNYNFSREAETSAYMYITFIRGAEEYFKASINNAQTPFSNVGIIADDDNMTIEYQLIEELSAESFKSALSYSCFLPMNSNFVQDLASRNVTFGVTNNANSILYNGAYTIRKLTYGKSYEYRKNPHYWDADNVTTERIILNRLPATSGPSTGRLYFESGESDGFTPDIKDNQGWKEYVTGKDGKGTYYEPANQFTQVVEGISSSTIWYNSFNLNRISESTKSSVVSTAKTYLQKAMAGGGAYANAKNEYKGSGNDQIAAQIENTMKALRNRSFRLGLQHSFPRHLQLSTYTPHNPTQWMRNNMTMPNFTTVEPGVDYVDVIAKNYAEKQALNPDSRPAALVETLTPAQASAKLADGSDGLYNLELAKFYFEKAKTELTDVKFPVLVQDVYPYIAEGEQIYGEYEKFFNGLTGNAKPGVDYQVAEADYGQVKDYINYAAVGLDSNIYIEVMDSGFYDMMTVGWTPDYADPLTYVQTHCNGGMMTGQMNHLEKDDPVTLQVFAKVDQALAEASEAGHGGDIVGRLKKLAEAEYYLVHDEAIILPLYAANIGTAISVSRIVPYNTQRNPVGLASEKFKGLVVRNNPITDAERKELYAAFKDARDAALAANA